MFTPPKKKKAFCKFPEKCSFFFLLLFFFFFVFLSDEKPHELTATGGNSKVCKVSFQSFSLMGLLSGVTQQRASRSEK